MSAGSGAGWARSKVRSRWKIKFGVRSRRGDGTWLVLLMRQVSLEVGAHGLGSSVIEVTGFRIEFILVFS